MGVDTGKPKLGLPGDQGAEFPGPVQHLGIFGTEPASGPSVFLAVSAEAERSADRVFWAMLRAVLSVIYSQAHEQISTRFSAFKKAYVS